jgi:carbonic anhydrase
MALHTTNPQAETLEKITKLHYFKVCFPNRIKYIKESWMPENPPETSFSVSDSAQNAVAPLPPNLTGRYKDWHRSEYNRDRALYEKLATGQEPHSMVISCCDSRVNTTKLFKCESGELFIHRNIANMVPPCDPEGEHHSTAAALEFAVTVLKISHLIIVGHSACGGIKGGFHLCKKNNVSPEKLGSFQKWLHLVQPAYQRLDHGKSEDDQINDLEKMSVVMSIENLMGYPFIKDSTDNGKLSIHGLWHDIGSGQMLAYDAHDGVFNPV